MIELITDVQLAERMQISYSEMRRRFSAKDRLIHRMYHDAVQGEKARRLEIDRKLGPLGR